MKIKISFILCVLFLIIIFSGCLFDSDSDKIIGRYIVLWIDLPQRQNISEQDELHPDGSSPVIPEYVFAVGHNNNYIIAKQHPMNEFDGDKIDTKITNFYIIDIHNKTEQTDYKVLGPLSHYQFDSARASLKIEDIKFNMNYVDSL